MIEAINFCLPYVDSGTIEQLVPKLIDIIKTGVGMATKVRMDLCVRRICLVREDLCQKSPHVVDMSGYVGGTCRVVLCGWLWEVILVEKVLCCGRQIFGFRLQPTILQF